MKKILSLILTVIMVISAVFVLPFDALALDKSGNCGNEEDWNNINLGWNNEALGEAQMQYNYIPPCEHNIVIDSAIEPTCTEAGKTEGEHCSLCGEIIKAQEDVPALGHDFGEWKETTAPSCLGTGEETRKCTRCTASETKEIPALGHDFKVTVYEPTCTDEGYTSHCCTRCRYGYATDEVPALGHDLGEWETAIAPTCTKKGEEKRSCSRCDFSETREVAVLGHTPVVDAAVKPTCAQKGKTEGKHCSVCGAVIVAQKDIAVIDHDLSIITIPATTTKEGAIKYYCKNCGLVFKTEKIAKLPKKENTLNVKAKTAALKYSKLKKKNQTISVKKVLSITKAQGTLTYTKSSGNKKITIDKKTGKVTVKKGLKKGTYSVKVKVKAAGNSNYKAKTKTVTFKVKVK